MIIVIFLKIVILKEDLQLVIFKTKNQIQANHKMNPDYDFESK